MRILFLLAILAVIGLVVTGAITLQKDDDQKITIQIDRTRVRQDAKAALQKGQEVLEGAESAFRRSEEKTSTQ